MCPEIPAWLNRRKDAAGPLASLLSEMMGRQIRIRKGMKSNVNVARPPRGTAMDWFSGFGLPTHPPSRHAFSRQWLFGFSFPSRLRGSGGI